LLLSLFQLNKAHAYLPAPAINVKIAEGNTFLISATRGFYKIKDQKKEEIFYHPVKIKFSPAGIDINGKIWDKEIKIEPDDNSFCEVNQKSYRGIIIIKKAKGKLEVINKVNLEEYLYGVIKLEISPEWPLATLCAQAIVARTYAVRRLWNNFPITNLPQHQAYGGVKAEDARAAIAVDITRGEILTYHGQPANSVYHACSGGYITSSKEVWGEDYPYLRVQKDPFSLNSPYSRWKLRVSKKELEKKLQRSGFKVRQIKSLVITEKDLSGRCKTLLVSCKSGSYIISGRKLREILGPDVLRSTLFKVKNEGSFFLFEGRGWGHGVGMSQWGAARMGELGYTTEQILSFYYPGTEIKKIY